MSYERSPLHTASERGHTRIVSLLLTHNAKVDRVDKGHNSALMLASQGGHTEVINLLLAKNAEVNLSNETGHTALKLAALSRQQESVHALLNGGANINDTNYLVDAALKSPHDNILTQPILQEITNHKERLNEVAAFLISFAQRDDHDNISSNIYVHRLNGDQKALPAMMRCV